MHATPVPILLSEPSVSTVEAILHAESSNMMLSEPALATLNGIFDSTKTVVSGVSSALSTAWDMRRRDPAVLVQPLAAQWPKVKLHPNPFRGYAPGSTDISHTKMAVSIVDGRRLSAAAIQPPDRVRWKEEPET